MPCHFSQWTSRIGFLKYVINKDNKLEKIIRKKVILKDKLAYESLLSINISIVVNLISSYLGNMFYYVYNQNKE